MRRDESREFTAEELGAVPGFQSLEKLRKSFGDDGLLLKVQKKIDDLQAKILDEEKGSKKDVALLEQDQAKLKVLEGWRHELLDSIKARDKQGSEPFRSPLLPRAEHLFEEKDFE